LITHAFYLESGGFARRKILFKGNHKAQKTASSTAFRLFENPPPTDKQRPPPTNILQGGCGGFVISFYS